MVQSRLNRRIRKVRNNISGRQKLLSKLLRIKKQQKRRPKRTKQRKVSKRRRTIKKPRVIRIPKRRKP